MPKSLIFAAALVALGFSLPAQARDKNDECVRVGQVRAFAVESGTAVLVRQGPGQFRRVVIEAGCPAHEADRIGFAQGPMQAYVQTRMGRMVPVARGGVVMHRVCTGTRHAYMSFIQDGQDERSRCKIVAVEPVGAAQFEAAGAGRDNRY